MNKLVFVMLLSISQGIYAEPTVSIKTNYYNVKGSTPTVIRKDMNNKRSGKYDAYTNWHVTWRFNTKKNRTRECEISDINISLNIKYLFPQWKPDRAVNNDVKDRWNSYYTALTNHENQHKNIAVEMAQKIEHTLGALNNESDCKNLRKTANDTAHKILNTYKKKQNDFDKESNHGINDGAHFP